MIDLPTIVISSGASLSLQGMYYQVVTFPRLLEEKNLQMLIFHRKATRLLERNTKLLDVALDASKEWHSLSKTGRDQSVPDDSPAWYRHRQGLEERRAILRGALLGSESNYFTEQVKEFEVVLGVACSDMTSLGISSDFRASLPLLSRTFQTAMQFGRDRTKSDRDDYELEINNRQSELQSIIKSKNIALNGTAIFFVAVVVAIGLETLGLPRMKQILIDLFAIVFFASLWASIRFHVKHLESSIMSRMSKLATLS